MTDRNTGQSGPIGLIVVDDSPVDAELMVDTLRKAGLVADVRRVDDETAFRAALDEQLPDAILAGWALPHFSGLKTLAIARERCPEVPLIFVSGTIPESTALEALRQGAADCVFKHQLQQLGPALVRALGKARALRSLRESAETYHSLFDNMLNGSAYCRMLFENGLPQDFIYLNVNKAFETQTGLKNVVGRKVSEIIPGIRESDPILFETYGRVAMTGQPEHFETYVEALRMWFSISVYSPKQEHFVAVFDVITERKLAEKAVEREQNRLEVILKTASDGIHILDAEGLLIDANDAFLNMLGYDRTVIGRLHVTDWDVQMDGAAVREILKEHIGWHDSLPLLIETRHRRSDGRIIDVEINVRGFEFDGQGYVCASSRDVTERKAAATKILRLTQLYAALSQCNQAIVRCAGEEDLFPQICRDAVQFGGFRMAWIGLIDPATLMVLPVASFGEGIEYLQDIDIPFDADNPFAHGPTAIAIHEGRPFWCQDFKNDPVTAPWHERGAQFGWAATASLPLHRGGVVIGAFSLYAGEISAFDEAARNLLVEMAIDIDFALNNFAREKERKQAEDESRILTQRINLATEAASVGIWDWNLETDEWFATPTYFTMLGYDPDEGFTFPDHWIKRIHPEDVDSVTEKIRAALAGNEAPYQYEARILHADGAYRWISVDGRIVEWDVNGKASRMLGVRMDITERKHAEQELRIAATAFEAQEGIFVTDAHNVILRVNQAFTRLTGYSAEETIGQTPSLLKSGRHDPDFYRSMWESLNRDNCWQGEIWNRYKNGEVHPGWLAITAATNVRGQVTNYIGTYYDLTQSKEADEKIRLLAFYDPLTGLPNRRLLIDRLQQSLAAGARHHNHGAVLFVDLDNFKTLNDTKGHDIGDLLLIEVASRLQACVREEDTVARLGGDEFVIMLGELSEDIQQAATQAEVVAEKILGAIRQPYSLKGYGYHSSTSIGINLFHENDITVDELLKRADIAMYAAKDAGRNTLRFYDPASQVALEVRTALENDLRRALAENQFRLYYQMQVDQTGHIHGAEVLIRWQHPQRGLISPMEFIPLAEETGLILPIGHWALETACAQLATWASRKEMAGLSLAVNVSARQFHHPDFVDQVLAVLEHTGANPHKLKLELTESLVLDNIEDTIVKMQALRKRGVRFSMDDFGTGYSSLSYLSQLPLDQLKIDQSFVRNIGMKSTDKAIVQTIIGMAHNLGMEIIAEGVETEDQRAFLEQHGCTLYQGYLFSRPVPVGELVEKFEARLKKS